MPSLVISVLYMCYGSTALKVSCCEFGDDSNYSIWTVHDLERRLGRGEGGDYNLPRGATGAGFKKPSKYFSIASKPGRP